MPSRFVDLGTLHGEDLSKIAGDIASDAGRMVEQSLRVVTEWAGGVSSGKDTPHNIPDAMYKLYGNATTGFMARMERSLSPSDIHTLYESVAVLCLSMCVVIVRLLWLCVRSRVWISRHIKID